MISETDRDLLVQVNALLEQGKNVSQAAVELGFDKKNTLYQRLYRLGYRVESRSRLVPIHAPTIVSTHPTALSTPEQ
jgi:transposase-like protein